MKTADFIDEIMDEAQSLRAHLIDAHRDGKVDTATKVLAQTLYEDLGKLSPDQREQRYRQRGQRVVALTEENQRLRQENRLLRTPPKGKKGKNRKVVPATALRLPDGQEVHWARTDGQEVHRARIRLGTCVIDVIDTGRPQRQPRQ